MLKKFAKNGDVELLKKSQSEIKKEEIALAEKNRYSFAAIISEMTKFEFMTPDTRSVLMDLKYSDDVDLHTHIKSYQSHKNPSRFKAESQFFITHKFNL